MANDPASPPAGLAQPDSRSYAALRIPASRTYLICSALAMMADSIEHVISYYIIFEKFQSPALAGFAVIAHWVPFLLFSIWAGALADRFDPRRIIQVGMGLFMLVSLGWGVLFMTDTLQGWHAVVLLVLHGFAGVLWSPASQILLHDIVGERQLQSAIRLLSTFRTLGFLLGPAIGAMLLKFTGPSAGILINVLIYLPLVLWLIGNPDRVHTQSGPSARVVSGWSDMAQAVRQISGIPLVFAMTALAALAATFIGNAHDPQMPAFARDLGYSGRDFHYGLLLTAGALGAITAGVILESRSMLNSHPRTAFMLGLGWSLAMFGFALSQSYILSFLLLACAGFLDLSFNAMTRTLVQLHSPQAIRGRAIGLFNVGSLGCRTFSGLTVGFGGGVIGIHWSLALSALALFGSMLLLYRWAGQVGGTRIAA